MHTNNATYTDILAIQREQLAEKITELETIAAHLPVILNALNKRVVEENSKINFDKPAIDQVFRGQDIGWAVDKIVYDLTHTD
jgi:hypothetical protein